MNLGPRVIKIGLTGGIGSGKSKVAELFSDLGVPVIDADVIAKKISQQPQIIAEIVEHFGPQVKDSNGELNRRKLREYIFNNDQQRNWLEKLLHPLILQAMQVEVSQLNYPYCLLVAPLLLEATQPHEWIDRVLVVDTAEENQITRTMQRDHLSREEVMNILRAQLPRAQRLARADDVIVNDGDLKQLAVEVGKLDKFYKSIRRQSP